MNGNLKRNEEPQIVGEHPHLSSLKVLVPTVCAQQWEMREPPLQQPDSWLSPYSK